MNSNFVREIVVFFKIHYLDKDELIFSETSRLFFYPQDVCMGKVSDPKLLI